MGVALPLGFLGAAAPAYLTEGDWDRLGDDWLEQSLAYNAAECKGTRGPLTRIRPRPARAGSGIPGPAYRLADFLDQHGRRSRRAVIPPAEFWAAAADLTDPRDLGALARAAESRGLLYDAARLRKAATAHGNVVTATLPLIPSLRPAHPADESLPRQLIAHSDRDDPYVTARLLSPLRTMGATDQVEALAERAAAHSPLDDPYAIAWLLLALRKIEATDLVTVLLARDPATHAALDNPYAIAWLLEALRKVGAADQIAILLARDPAAHASLHNPGATARLLTALREVGASDQVEALATRAAAHSPLHNPHATARLLSTLRGADMTRQLTLLLNRDPASHASLKNPDAVEHLLRALRAVGAEGQAQALAARADARLPAC